MWTRGGWACLGAGHGVVAAMRDGRLWFVARKGGARLRCVVGCIDSTWISIAATLLPRVVQGGLAGRGRAAAWLRLRLGHALTRGQSDFALLCSFSFSLSPRDGIHQPHPALPLPRSRLILICTPRTPRITSSSPFDETQSPRSMASSSSSRGSVGSGGRQTTRAYNQLAALRLECAQGIPAQWASTESLWRRRQ